MTKRNAVNIVVILLIVASSILYVCTFSKKEVSVIKVENTNWAASINTNKKIKNGKEFFAIDYTFKGDINILREQKKISFHMGTAYGTEGVVFFDKSLQTDENEQIPSIIKVDFNKLESNLFSVQYAYPKATKKEFYEAILKSGITLQISMSNEAKDNQINIETLKFPR